MDNSHGHPQYPRQPNNQQPNQQPNARPNMHQLHRRYPSQPQQPVSGISFPQAYMENPHASSTFSSMNTVPQYAANPSGFSTLSPSPSSANPLSSQSAEGLNLLSLKPSQHSAPSFSHSSLYGFQQGQQQQQQQQPQNTTPTRIHHHHSNSAVIQYGNVQPFGTAPHPSVASSPSANLPVLQAQYGVPQNYYIAPDTAVVTASAAQVGHPMQLSNPTSPDHINQQYNTSTITYPTLLTTNQHTPSFTPDMANDTGSIPRNAGAQAFVESSVYATPSHAEVQPVYATTAVASITAAPPPPIAANSSTNKIDLEALLPVYHQELIRCYQMVREYRLYEAGQSLMRLSAWLAGNVENLGLHLDDTASNAQRMKLWNQYNIAWLSTFQRQKDLSLRSNQLQLQPGMSIMEVTQMEQMGQALIKFCDKVEKHGLVDYEMGIWEKQIITLILECLGLLEPLRIPSSSSSSRRHSSLR